MNGIGAFMPSQSNRTAGPAALAHFGYMVYLPRNCRDGLVAARSVRGFSSVTSSDAALSSRLGRYVAYAALCGVSAVVTLYTYPGPQKKEEPVYDEHTVTNWSGTHEAQTRVYFEPETLHQLEGIVDHAQRKKQKIRPVGSGLSPNGIGLSDEGMVNLALMDKIIDVDPVKQTVTVQAGARVGQLVEALRPYGLTLQNFASIKEQQIGGFIQVVTESGIRKLYGGVVVYMLA